MTVVVNSDKKQSAPLHTRRPAEHPPLPRWVPRLRSTRLAADVYLLAEITVVFLCGLGAAIYHVGHNLGAIDYMRDYFTPLVALPLFFAMIAKSWQLYDFQALCKVSTAVGKTIGSLLAAFSLLIVLGFALGIANDYSRLWLGLWLVSSGIAVIAMRVIASALFVRAARAGLIRRRTAIFGSAGPVARVLEEMDRASPEIHVIGTFAERGGHPWNASNDVVSHLDELVAFGQAEDVDLVIVARNAFADDSLHDILSALSVLPAEVQLFLDFGEASVPIRGVSKLNSLAMLDVQRRPVSGWNRLLKILEDYTVATAATVLLAPVLLLIAAAIKLDSRGPVFFRQRRHGFNQSVINVWKFRTMRVMEDGDNVVQAVRGDDRVTRVGRILRQTSLDELPQLFNVLRGEMSIVGPRPHPIAFNDRYTELLGRYGSRHRVKPGITGWAQINGFRGPTDTPYQLQRRVELDLEYIERWSVWMDLKIIALTPARGLVHPNAF